MDGMALTIKCALDKHSECDNDIIGYKGAHVDCDCKCHKSSHKKHAL